MTLDPTTWQGHTPGPWGRNIPPASQYPVIYAGRNTHVAQVLTRFVSGTEAEANANAIAALPDIIADHARLLAENARLREALVTAIRVAGEAREQWDAAPAGMKAGKLLMALSNPSLRYREDITTMHAAAETRA